MDEFSSRRTATGLFFARKGSVLVDRDQSTPICSRVRCSSRMCSIKDNQIASDKPKTTRRPFPLPTNGKEAIGSSSRTPVAPNPRKLPSQQARNNVSGESTSKNSKNLKCNLFNDAESSSTSTSTSKSSSSMSELNIPRKRVTGRNRIGDPQLDSRRNNDSHHGIISNSDSRRTRNLSSTRNNNVTLVTPPRSTARARPNEQENRRRTQHTNASGRLGNRSANTRREDLSQYDLESVSEMLLDLDGFEQDEALTYEQLFALETRFFERGLGLHDRHRDMRLDIDDMSYEELLALEERMGTVSTALTEAELAKCLKKSIYEASTTGVGKDGDVKCSICQEEYKDGDEVGRLVCEHRYHVECIEKWLKLKNWCPICKASAAPSPPVSSL